MRLPFSLSSLFTLCPLSFSLFFIFLLFSFPGGYGVLGAIFDITIACFWEPEGEGERCVWGGGGVEGGFCLRYIKLYGIVYLIE